MSRHQYLLAVQETYGFGMEFLLEDVKSYVRGLGARGKGVRFEMRNYKIWDINVDAESAVPQTFPVVGCHPDTWGYTIVQSK